MKITELNGQLAKICKNSIRVVDDYGKTAGVITQCQELQPRDESLIWGKVRKAVGLNAAECIHKMRRVDGDIYYLENVNVKDDNANALKDVGINVVRYRRLA